jgi:hypothetical protein
MTFGVVGATGPAGAAGPLSGLTCGADEFAASFNGVWTCAVLGATADGIFSGDGSYWDGNIAGFVTSKDYISIGFNTSASCGMNTCNFEVRGVADHSACTISGALGNNSFNTASNGVTRNVNRVTVSWVDATGATLSGNGALNVQVSCAQGVIPAT